MNVKRIVVETDTEIWKTVVGYQDYEVSNYGRIRSNKYGKIRIIKTPKNKYGYPRVNFCNDGKIHCKAVHRIVLETFIGECPSGMECSHLDGDMSNNKLSNLKWETHTDNLRKNSDVKLNLLKASWIRLLLQRGWRVNYIAKKFGVHHQIISRIKSNNAWTHPNCGKRIKYVESEE